MPNIIEQQDLLKGLPDARLATLMQNPVGDIPPFLVAAEAQRRQSIRQQFSGAGSNESVVDSLTKQMTNGAENIQAPAQTPPQMPPPQAGIGALPQDQQGMSGGGPVRRFAGQGYVEPMWKIPNYSGVIPQVGDWVGERATELYDYATTPWNQQGTDNSSNSKSDADFSIPDTKLPKPNPNFATTGQPSPYTDLTPKKPQSSTAGTADTSPENKYKAMEADYRKRLEDLYGTEEPSNWENAQKWFAMSQQIMNPDASLMEGLVNAGAVYAGSKGEQAAQQRRAARAKDEALLNWDMQIMQSDRALEAAAADRAQARAEKLADRAYIGPEALLKHYDDQIATILKLAESEMDPVKKDALLKQVEGLRITAAEVANMGGGEGNVVTRDQLQQSNFSFN